MLPDTEAFKLVERIEPTGEPTVSPKPRYRLQKGMRIEVLGCMYKVIAVRPNGKVTLRYEGEIR